MRFEVPDSFLARLEEALRRRDTFNAGSGRTPMFALDTLTETYLGWLEEDGPWPENEADVAAALRLLEARNILGSCEVSLAGWEARVWGLKGRAILFRHAVGLLPEIAAGVVLEDVLAQRAEEPTTHKFRVQRVTELEIFIKPVDAKGPAQPMMAERLFYLLLAGRMRVQGAEEFDAAVEAFMSWGTPSPEAGATGEGSGDGGEGAAATQGGGV